MPTFNKSIGAVVLVVAGLAYFRHYTSNNGREEGIPAPLINTFSSSSKSAGKNAEKITVAITGATGQLGRAVLKQLEHSPHYSPLAFVRSLSKMKSSREEFPNLSPLNYAVLSDFRIKGPDAEIFLRDSQYLIVCTAAQPKLTYSSLPTVLLGKLTGVASKPTFHFDKGQSPRDVEYEANLNLFQAAKKAGVKHVIFVSSMAGTDPSHFLNTQMDNIVLWKRKAELALINSGLEYTIIHPGGLLKNDVAGGERELLVGVDDTLIKVGLKTSIPRHDVATIIVGALSSASAKNKSFDLAAKSPGEGKVYDGNLDGLLGKLGKKVYDYSTPDLETVLGE